MSCKSKTLPLLYILIVSLLIHPFFQDTLRCHAQSENRSTVQFPRLQRFELLNGLRVLAIERALNKQVVVSLLIKSGSSFDPPGKPGLAYLTAQAVCFASGKTTPARWKDELEFLGVNFSIRVDSDYTVFQAEVPSSNLETFLSTLTNVVLRPVFKQEGLERLKQDVKSKVSNNYDSLELCKKHFRELIYGKSPCANSPHGGWDSIREIRLSDVQEFHRNHYLPNNAALIVVGGTTPFGLTILVREKLGGWVKGVVPAIELPSTQFAGLVSNSIRVVERKDSLDATVILGHAGPSRITPDYYCLQLANLILGGLEDSSRLEQTFHSKNISYTKVTSEMQFGQNCGHFLVSAQLPSSSLSRALPAISENIEDLKTSHISEEELNAAKSKLTAWFADLLKSDSLLADQMIDMELYNLASDYLAGFFGDINRVTVERLQEAIKNHLSSTRATIVIVGDAPKIKSELGPDRTVELID